MDWKHIYNKPTIYTQPTTLGHLEIVVDKPLKWNHQTWFFFHGAGGDSNSWRGFCDKIFENYEGDAFPNIVGISIGEKWFLVDSISDDSKKGSTLFWKTCIVEVKNIIPNLGDAVAVGHSMGGFNAFSLFLDNPAFWKSIVLMSPAISDLSPYASQEEKEKYIERTRCLDWKQVLRFILRKNRDKTAEIEVILNNWRHLAESDDDWRVINPIERLRHLQVPSNTSIYISCGKCDPFGFLEGSAIIADRLASAGFRVEFHSLSGGHIAIPYADISRFLLGK